MKIGCHGYKGKEWKSLNWLYRGLRRDAEGRLMGALIRDGLVPTSELSVKMKRWDGEESIPYRGSTTFSVFARKLKGK